MVDWLKQLGLRWVILYLVLYIVFGGLVLSFVGEALFPPGLRWIGDFSFPLWRVVVPWVGEHIFAKHITAASFTYGQSEMEAAITLVLAFLGAIAWTCLERNRQRERALYEATRILVRYSLVVIMFLYGFEKTLHIQFRYPGPTVLMEPFGSLSPMHLMWAFMGVTTLYSFFGGFAELAGGVLLLFRRTTTIGALVVAGVMSNVVVMDIAYNAGSVTLWGIHLLFMAIFLLASDVQRLTNAFVLYRPLPAVSFTHVWPRAWMAPTSIVLKVSFIGWILYGLLSQELAERSSTIAAHKLPWRGLYQVEHFSSTKKSFPALTTDGSAWVRVAIDGEDDDGVVPLNFSGAGPLGQTMDVRTAGDTMQHYQLQIQQINSTHGLFKLTRLNSIWANAMDDRTPISTIVFRYVIMHNPTSENATSSNAEVLALNGAINGAPVFMQLNRLDIKKFLLTRSRFQRD